MIKTTFIIEGMMCAHCEASVQNMFKEKFAAKEVKADHGKNEVSVVTESEIDLEKAGSEIEKLGYKYISAVSEPWQKKNVFSFGKKMV